MANWLCWHIGTVRDEKLAAVAKRSNNAPRHLVIAFWAYLLETASEASPRGSLGSLDIESAAILLDADESVLLAIFQNMQAKEMVLNDEISNWKKRQFNESTERVRAYRERKKHDETLRNVSETNVTTGQDIHTGQTEKRDISKIVKDLAKNKKMPTSEISPDYGDKAVRKAKWFQNVSEEINLTETSERAFNIIACYQRGEKWAVEEFERYDGILKARKSNGSDHLQIS